MSFTLLVSRIYRSYILSVIDAFTKFIRLYACKSTSANESVKHLKDYFRCYSKPRKRLVSDRGSTFTCEEFKIFMKSESIEHILIAVGTSRANGQVKRLNRVLTLMLAKLCDRPDKWDQVIHLAEFAINNTVSRSTGNIPSQLLFGLDQLGQVNDLLRLILNNQVRENRDLSDLREIASERIIDSQIANKKVYDRSHKKATSYKKGNYVVITNVDTTAGVNKKLIPKFKGPYIVNKVLDADRYVVCDIPGFQVTQIPYNSVVSTDHMKPWMQG